jgi:hypothetical protein
MGLDSVDVVHRAAVEIEKAAPRDWIDYAQGLGTLLVAPIFAIIAARIGAREGGRLAAEAGRDAIREEFAEERRMARRNLMARMKHNLPRMIAACDEAQKLKAGEPIPLSIPEELEIMWNTYYRAAEPIFTLGSPEFQEKAEKVFADAHTEGVKIRAIEDLHTSLNPAKPENENPKRNRVSKGRAEALAALKTLRGRATDLQAEVKQLPDQ